MEDYDWLLDLVNLVCSLYVPYKFFKSLLDADKEIGTIIRCQKSIQYIRTTKIEGHIDYDSKLEENFRKLETDLRSKLEEARKKRQQFSIGNVHPVPYQSINIDSDSNRSNNVNVDSSQSFNTDFDFFDFDL